MSGAPPTTGLLALCRWAGRFAFQRPAGLTAAVMTTLLKAGLDLLKPWPMVYLVNALPHADRSFVAWCVGAAILIFFLSWAAGLANTFANVTLGQRLTYDVASELFAKLQQLSLHFHARHSIGDNVRRATTDCGCVSVIVLSAALPVMSSALTMIAMFVILWKTNLMLALLALAIAPLMALVFYFYAQPMTRLGYTQQEAEARIYEVAERTFSAMPVVAAFGREQWNDLAFADACERTVAATARLTRVQLQFKALIGFAMALGTALIFWFGGHAALNGGISIGAVLLFLSYLAAFYDPLATVMYTSVTVETAAGSALRVRELLETQSDVTDKPGAAPLGAIMGAVEIQDVTVGYEPGRPVLRNVSLRANRGEMIAMVGPTGAGKSTLVALIPRFFDPWQGRVLVDSRDVRDVALKSLRDRIAIVLQEPFLFPLSAAENIAYGRPGATREEIETAARAANAHEFILKLPGGYDTVIGERGATLSGGERQRLSLARAYLKNAPILILDEPTSAIDAASEAAVVDALEKLRKGRTVFIIAHRMSTITMATRIVELRDGTIC